MGILTARPNRVAQFWSLALYRRDDYAKSGLPMLPVTHGMQFTQLHIWLYTIDQTKNA